MTARDLPSPALLRKLLRYDHATGKLFWRERGREFFRSDRDWKIWNTRFAGAEAGRINDQGYRLVSIFKRQIRAHRIIWAMETGQWPTDQIDHEDHDRDNNRWANLREATNAENARNQSMRADNTSGVCGVYWNKCANKWQSYINNGGKTIYLGIYDAMSDAIYTRRLAELKLRFHKNHGVPK